MILPDNLAPLPVIPRGEDTASSGDPDYEDFVSAAEVRKVLLGTKDELPVAILLADDFDDSFAGRADVARSSRTAPVMGLQAPMRVPELEMPPQAIHRAFEILKPEPRRAAPPRPRKEIDCEADFGRTRISDAWWVLGMGAAAAAILFSGTLVDFVSRESMRRSLSQHPAASEVFRGAAPAVSPAQEELPGSLAAKADPDDEP